jgi:TonB family protein
MAEVNDDISKYLKGEMTPAEMHALEKRALEDPFLADALAGFDALEPGVIDDDLAKLKTSLRERTGKQGTGVIPMWRWPLRIAAGLLILFVAGLFLFNPFGGETKKELALQSEPPSAPERKSDDLPADTESEDVEIPPSVAPAEADKPSVSQSSDEPAKQLVDESKKAESAQPLPADPAPIDIVEPDSFAAVADDKIVRKKDTAEKAGEGERTALTHERVETAEKTKRLAEKDVAATAGAPLAQEARGEVARSKAPTTNVVRGRVSDDTGAPLPGVNVVIKGTNEGAVTDLSGRYQIAVASQPTTLVYSFIGFTEEEMETGNQKEIDVTLHPDVSELSEVVVVGYGAERYSDPSSFANLEFASPVGGQRAYKQYIESNLHYPHRALEQHVEGKVTVQFTVEPSGQLTDFSIVRGIGFGCDEEVIRLIREGPAWSPTRREDESLRDKVKVRVKFSLPKK